MEGMAALFGAGSGELKSSEHTIHQGSMDLLAMTQLLKESEEDDEEGAAAPRKGGITPASFGAPKDDGVKIPKAKAMSDPKAIWTDADLVDELDEDDDEDDGLIIPKYEFMYKQAVSTADNFLGMAYVHKDPSSHDCEDLTLRIELPGTAGMSDLDLDVKETLLKLRSPTYKLNLYLPHKVDDKKGSAKWDSKQEVLKVTLPIIRDGEWEL